MSRVLRVVLVYFRVFQRLSAAPCSRAVNQPIRLTTKSGIIEKTNKLSVVKSSAVGNLCAFALISRCYMCVAADRVGDCLPIPLPWSVEGTAVRLVVPQAKEPGH